MKTIPECTPFFSLNHPSNNTSQQFAAESWLTTLDSAALAAADRFPLRITSAVAKRLDWHNPADPLVRQFRPTGEELQVQLGFVDDPLEEKRFEIGQGVIQKYSGRVLLRLTDSCPVHCRYCFRRQGGLATIPQNLAGWQSALQMIQADNTIHEVIFSGGDPLMLPDKRLARLTEALAAIPHLTRLRIHTRMPVVLPQRIGLSLLNWLKNTRLVALIVIHVNHPAEIDTPVREALGRLVDAGIPLLNQSVLLKGVNDDVETLVALSESLIQSRVMPYYLHLLDPVSGTAHFQVDEIQAQRLIQEIRNRLPGYAIPRLARERPGESAKIML